MSNGSIVRDGAMMILLALKLINPNTQVGISNLKQELNDMAPAKAGNNIGEMLLMMQSLIQQIELKGGTHQDLVLNIFNSCEKSSNATFVNFTRTLRDEWESSLDDETDSEETIIDKLANNIYARDPKKTASDPPDDCAEGFLVSKRSQFIKPTLRARNE